MLLLMLAICLTGCTHPSGLCTTPLPRPHRDTVDYTVGEASVCQVHHIQMVRTTVPIAYGLLMPTPQGQARYAASTNAFPNADRYVPGGCSITSDSPHKVVIYTCSECQQAAQAWDAAYGKTHPK